MDKNIVILASGRGSNAARIISHFANVEGVSVSSVISDRVNAGVHDIAGEMKIASKTIGKKEMNSGDLLAALKTADPDIIVLAGFLQMIPKDVISEFTGRIINIHPSLLPAHGGKGMYGRHVHRAVLDAGDNLTGISIHHVNEHYDKGRMIAQFSCEVLADDTIESLQKRVQELEHEYLPLVIEQLLK